MTPRATAVATAVAAGLAGWLAFPPWGLWMLAFAVPALLATAVTASDLSAWKMGAITGLVTNVALLHWLRFRATVVAWLLLAVIMAVWMALLATLLHRLLQRRWTIALIPFVWVGIEAWRNAWPFGGFGWATLGISQVDNAWFTPVGRVLGEKGYTFLVVALSLSVWLAIRDAMAARRGDFIPPVSGTAGTETSTWPASLRRRTDAATDGPHDSRMRLDGDVDGSDNTGLLLRSEAGRRAVSVMGDGAWVGTGAVVVTMLAVTLTTVGPPAVVDTLDVVAIQPNDIAVPDADYTTITRRLAEQAVALTRGEVESNGPADMVVWPEGSIGRDPALDPELAAAIMAGARITGGGLVVGTDLEDPDSDGYRRVSLVVDQDGTVTDTYVKRRLVPFGEFVPLRWVFDWYPALDQVSRDAIPSDHADNVVVTTPTGRAIVVAVAICFETMYSDVVMANVLVDDPAAVLVSSTSDATFGRSGQPAQHLDQIRMRAIETGREAVHAAVSGTTAFIDQDGRIVAGGTELFTQTSVRHTMGLVEGTTPFLRWGDLLDMTRWLVLVVVAGLWIAQRRHDDRRGMATSTAMTGPTSGSPADDTATTVSGRPDGRHDDPMSAPAGHTGTRSGVGALDADTLPDGSGT